MIDTMKLALIGDKDHLTFINLRCRLEFGAYDYLLVCRKLDMFAKAIEIVHVLLNNLASVLV